MDGTTTKAGAHIPCQIGHPETSPQSQGRVSVRKKTSEAGASPEIPGHSISDAMELLESEGVEFYPPEIAQKRMESVLLRMFSMPPDPHGARSKQAARDRKSKKRRFNNKAVIKEFKRHGKSVDIPYVFNGADKSNEMILLIHSLVPQGLNSAIRNDVCHDITVDILSGDLKLENVPKAVQKYIRAARAFMPKSEAQLIEQQRKRGGLAGADSWKAQVVAKYNPSLEEAIVDLKEQWTTGAFESAYRKRLGYEVSPRAKIIPQSPKFASNKRSKLVKPWKRG